MINRISYIESNVTDPYYNLALEEYLFFRCMEGECILYLWQNRNTVVIGKNQNAWAECNVTRLQADQGFLVRRMSGGGAVYHDAGNLNFTFVTRKADYDVEKQLQVILEALRRFGIAAEKSGRNDILVNGRKISGNAFYERGDRCYHHGTIMADVDTDKLSRYLTVSKAKLRSRGVSSVKSRVANLTEFAPGITIEAIKDNLFDAFEDIYGYSVDMVHLDEPDKINELTEKYASWDWNMGRKLDFQYEMSHQFSWGHLTLQIKVDGGVIDDATVFSDAMNPHIIEEIAGCIEGVKYDRAEIRNALKNFQYRNEADIYAVDAEQILHDICRWLGENEL